MRVINIVFFIFIYTNYKYLYKYNIMWEINDKYNYDLHNKHKLGQIKNDELFKDIQQYACNLNYKFCNYLLIHYDITKKRYNIIM